MLERTLRVNQLLSYYGELLTKKQQAMMKAYYEEDFSLAEIAEDHKISRQAVYDNLKRAEKALEEFEAKLQLSHKSDQRLSQLKELEGLTTLNPPAQEVLDTLIQQEL